MSETFSGLVRVFNQGGGVYMLEERPASLALPRLATGVGGVDWESVRPLLENQLGDLDCTVYVYNFTVPVKKP